MQLLSKSVDELTKVKGKEYEEDQSFLDMIANTSDCESQEDKYIAFSDLVA